MTKCRGEFFTEVKFIHCLLMRWEFFSLSSKPCSISSPGYWGKSLACIKRQLVSDLQTLPSGLTNTYSAAVRQTWKLRHHALQKASKNGYRHRKVSVWNVKFKIIYIWDRRPGVRLEMSQPRGFQDESNPSWRWKAAANWDRDLQFSVFSSAADRRSDQYRCLTELTRLTVIASHTSSE